MPGHPLGKMIGVVGGGQLGRMMVRTQRCPELVLTVTSFESGALRLTPST